LEAASHRGRTGSRKGSTQASRFIDECRGMSYEDRLKMVGLTTLETRRLRADMIEVYKILRGFEGTDESNFSKEEWDARKGVIRNCLKNGFI